MENVRCSNVSGDIYVSDIAGEDVSLSSTSGKVTAVNVFAEDLKLGSVSGRVTAQNISAEDLSVTGTSGRVELAGLAAEDVKVSTVSGSIDAYGNAENFHIKSVSGSIAAGGTVSGRGRVEDHFRKDFLRLPENQGLPRNIPVCRAILLQIFPLGRRGRPEGKSDIRIRRCGIYAEYHVRLHGNPSGKPLRRSRCIPLIQ